MQKLAQIKGSVLVSLCFFLLSCTAPPDVPTCTPYASIKYFEMENLFFKLCSDDPVCSSKLGSWREAFYSWTTPSESGWCIHIVSGKSYDVDKDHPFPFKNEKGQLKTWREVADTAALIPTKESWSPLKTYIQTNCRKYGKCGSIGNWQSTVNRFDERVKK